MTQEEQLPLNLIASEDFFARVASELADPKMDPASREVLEEFVSFVGENKQRIKPEAFKEQPEDDEGAPLKQSNLNTPKPKRPTESQLQLQDSNRDLTDNKYASDFGQLHVPKTPLKQGVAA